MDKEIMTDMDEVRGGVGMKSKWLTIPLGEIAVKRVGSTNPAKLPTKYFKLYSIPAYDDKQPETLLGSEIGSSKKNVEPDDVLIFRIVPHIQRVWIVGSKKEFTTTTETHLPHFCLLSSHLSLYPKEV